MPLLMLSARPALTVLVAALAATLSMAGAAHALTPTITSFSSGLNTGSVPRQVALGPDGNVWFTDQGSTKAIGRITPGGAITEFSAGLSGTSQPEGIAPAPAGDLWFADSSTPAIGEVTTAGTIGEFSSGLNSPAGPFGIVAGPDGSMWFADSHSPGSVGVINPTTHAITEFPAGAGTSLYSIAAGLDGNLWFTDEGSSPGRVGRFNPNTHGVTEFTSGLRMNANPVDIVSGPDGNLWFTDDGGAIGRVTPEGTITEFTTGLNPGSAPVGIGAGPDGALWFTDEGTTKAIGRITVAGEITEFSTTLTPSVDIAPGADGNMWFTAAGALAQITTPPTATTLLASATGPTSATVSGSANGHAQASSFHVEYGPPAGPSQTTPEQPLGSSSSTMQVSAALAGLQPNTDYQARVVVTNTTGTSDGALLAFKTPAQTLPADTDLKVTPRRFVAAAHGHSVLPARRRTGAIVSYRDSQAATTLLTVQRPAAGRREGKLCRKPTRRNRHGKRCTRYLKVGSFAHTDTAGANRFRFTGRVRGHTLRPGNYRLKAVAFSPIGPGGGTLTRFAVKR